MTIATQTDGADEPNHYVLLCRSDRFWLVGPFASQVGAAAWGRLTQTEGNDDPRWQTLRLTVQPHATRTPGLIFEPDHPDAAEFGEPDTVAQGKE